MSQQHVHHLVGAVKWQYMNPHLDKKLLFSNWTMNGVILNLNEFLHTVMNNLPLIPLLCTPLSAHNLFWALCLMYLLCRCLIMACVHVAQFCLFKTPSKVKHCKLAYAIKAVVSGLVVISFKIIILWISVPLPVPQIF